MSKCCDDLSVTVSVYKNDNPIFFKFAVDSVLNQTLKPKKLIITVDGPIGSELEDIIHEYEILPQCMILRSAKNRGLGLAHAQALSICDTEYIAIMDGDDISLLYRFEKQMNFLHEHPEIDVLGGYISEFVSEPDNVVGIREVKFEDKDIRQDLIKRCPFNHVSTILRRRMVLQAGNYMDWHYNEDYYLWCRMFLNGSKFANINDILVNVRVGTDMYKRRGGWKYFISEAKLQKYMLNNKIIHLPRFFINIVLRFVLQVIMPNWLRGIVFQHLARSKTNVQ